MRRLVPWLFVLSLTVWPSGRLSAQSVKPSGPRSVKASGAQSVGASGYVSFGVMRFAATESFDLVTGSSSTSGFAFGAIVSRVWHGVFADVSFWRHKSEGERFFVDGGSTYPLGIPVSITFQPIDLAGGWKFELGAVHPYIGGGVTFMSYKEESDFATGSDDVDERKTGGLLLIAADIPLGQFLRLGGEFRYRAVTGVLGESGVSAIFGEDRLGGSSYAFRVSVGR